RARLEPITARPTTPMLALPSFPDTRALLEFWGWGRIQASACRMLRSVEVSYTIGLRVGGARQRRREGDRGVDRLVEAQPVLAHELREVARVDAACEVVSGGDGCEGSGVVDEAARVEEPGRLGREFAEPCEP